MSQVFFVSIAIATFFQCKAFFYTNYLNWLLPTGTEVNLCSKFIKFKKEVATHAIALKIWTLILFATLIHIMVDCHAICFNGVFMWG